MDTTYRQTRLARSVIGLVLLLGGSTLTACTGTSESDNPEGAASVSSSPFSSDLRGPTQAEPGETITVELRNLGRLPDAYQVLVVPTGAAVLEENDYRLGPGESVKIDIKVKTTPFDLQLKTLGGGGSEIVALTVR